MIHIYGHPNSPTRCCGFGQDGEGPNIHQRPKPCTCLDPEAPQAPQVSRDISHVAQRDPSLASYRQGLEEQLCRLVLETVSCEEGGVISALQAGLLCPPTASLCQSPPLGTIRYRKSGKYLKQKYGHRGKQEEKGNYLPSPLTFSSCSA